MTSAVDRDARSRPGVRRGSRGRLDGVGCVDEVVVVGRAVARGRSARSASGDVRCVGRARVARRCGSGRRVGRGGRSRRAASPGRRGCAARRASRRSIGCTRSSTCAKSRDCVERLRSSTRSMTSLRSYSLTASASSRIVACRASCGPARRPRRWAADGRATWRGGRAADRSGRAWCTGGCRRASARGRRIASGRLDDHLVGLAREEAADAALADAVGRDDARVGTDLGADALEEVLEDSAPSNRSWLAKVHHPDRVELELRAELRVREDGQPRRGRVQQPAQRRRAAASQHTSTGSMPFISASSRFARDRERELLGDLRIEREVRAVVAGAQRLGERVLDDRLEREHRAACRRARATPRSPGRARCARPRRSARGPS